MFFAFTPFDIVSQPQAPAVSTNRGPADARALPLLPSPEKSRAASPSGTSVADAVAEIASFFNNGIKRALHSFTSSLTALGSRASAMFATIGATLALDRAARDTAASFGFAPAAQASSNIGFWPWGMPSLPVPVFQPFAPLMISSWPWAAFSEGFAAFFGAGRNHPQTSFFAYRAAPQKAVTSSMPGLPWGFTWNPQLH